MLAPGSIIIKLSPTTEDYQITINEPGKLVVAVNNSNIARFDSQLARQKSLNVYADCRKPRSSEKLLEEQIPSQLKEFTRKIKGDKKAEFCPRNRTLHARR